MWRSVPALAVLLGLSACGSGGGERAATGTPSAAPTRDAGHGQTVYDVRCSPCHGAEGAGDGPAAAAITPKPRNFRDPDFWKGRSPTQLRLVVKDGKPGTLMPPFEGILSDAELDDVVAYVQTFRPSGS